MTYGLRRPQSPLLYSPRLMCAKAVTAVTALQTLSEKELIV